MKKILNMLHKIPVSYLIMCAVLVYIFISLLNFGQNQLLIPLNYILILLGSFGLLGTIISMIIECIGKEEK